jgi:hypothetical protein
MLAIFFLVLTAFILKPFVDQGKHIYVNLRNVTVG